MEPRQRASKAADERAGARDQPAVFLARQFKLTRNVPFHASVNDHLPQYYITALTPPGVRSEFGD